MNEKNFTCRIEEELPENSNQDCNIDLNTGTTFPGKLAAFFDEPVKELIFNPDFEDELKALLARQKEFNNLRANYAEELYSKFIIPENQLEKDGDEFNSCIYRIYVNDIHLTHMKFIGYQSTYRAISFSNYKLLLMALNFPYAEWINPHQGTNKWIDLTAALLFHKIDYETKYSSNLNEMYFETERT